MDLKSIIDTRRRGDPDVFLFVTVLLLVGIGIAMSYSASAIHAARIYQDSFYFLKRQIVWFVLGLGALLVFQEVDYRRYARYTKILLLVSFVLLILVFVPVIGKSAKGSARWLSLGFVQIQPSEVVKLCLVLYLVKVFSSERTGVANHVAQLLVPAAIVALAFVLLMLQPDFGTAIDILLIAALILFVSGFPILYIATVGIVSVPMFYLLIYEVSYRKNRLLAYFDPWADRFGKGYHVVQSFIAFKKGGFLGTGLGYGTQKISRLPEPHTDFIFAVIAEETGILGTLLIIALFCTVFWRGLIISLGAPDEYGRLLAVGLTLYIVVQAFINIGVVSGALPTTGLPLPFISYGGSSLVCNMTAAGILLNISRYRAGAYEGVQLTEEVWQ